MSQTHPLNNVQVLVEGTVDFARTASQIEGDELARRVARDRSDFPTNTPHTLLELSNIQVIATGQDAQGQLAYSEGEAYILSKAFTRKNAEKGQCLTLENKTKSLPALLALNPQLGSYEQVVHPKGEIAPGTRVKVVLRLYFVQTYKKVGYNLEAILVDTPEVPYSSGRGSLDLSAWGITLAGPIVNTEPAAGNQAQGQAPQNVAAGTDASTGLPSAPQAPQAPSAPQGYPAQQPQAQYQAPAPAAPVVPPAAQYQVPQAQAPQGYQAPQGQDPFAGQSPQWGGQGQGIVAPE